MVFLDMGSGIGNVVLQVAGQTLCDCYGIEIMENPSILAKNQLSEFQNRMEFYYFIVRLYNLPCGKIELVKGDFLDNQLIDSVIKRADVIFVNK